MRPGVILLLLLALTLAGAARESSEVPFAAGGTALTVRIAADSPEDTLLWLPRAMDPASREGEVMFRRHWVDAAPSGQTARIDNAVTRCADCHVEAGQAQQHAARAENGRLAPSLFGWSLLEAIPASTLERMADPLDGNGDGISGRLPLVPVIATGETAAGRFGWKSAQPDLKQQIATALIDDLGISTPLYADADAPDAEPQVSASALASLEHYVAGIAVPDRRERHDPRVHLGERVFAQAGCASCHVPAQITGYHPDPALSNQVVWPYSDLLLHDMGVALAAPAGTADAREWRTPPLWGMGLMLQRHPARGLLHDGRARSLLEAIEWHGGEARASRDAVRALPVDEREGLILFLRSL